MIPERAQRVLDDILRVWIELGLAHQAIPSACHEEDGGLCVRQGDYILSLYGLAANSLAGSIVVELAQVGREEEPFFFLEYELQSRVWSWEGRNFLPAFDALAKFLVENGTLTGDKYENGLVWVRRLGEIFLSLGVAH